MIQGNVQTKKRRHVFPPNVHPHAQVEILLDIQETRPDVPLSRLCLSRTRRPTRLGDRETTDHHGRRRCEHAVVWIRIEETGKHGLRFSRGHS